MKTEDKKHVQVPNKMTEEHNDLKPGDILIYATIKRHMDKDTKTCYPSLAKISEECGASINTVRSSIQNLENAGYIQVYPYKRGKLYKFLKWDKFEPFSYEYLDNKNLSFKEKAYILVTQQYMFKKPEDQDGIVTYNNIELANRINISPSTISRLDSSLINKNMMEINTLTVRDQENGLPIKQKVFHLSKMEQAIVFILGNHEQRILSIEERMDRLEEDNQRLTEENKKLIEKLENKS